MAKLKQIELGALRYSGLFLFYNECLSFSIFISCVSFNVLLYMIVLFSHLLSTKSAQKLFSKFSKCYFFSLKLEKLVLTT